MCSRAGELAVNRRLQFELALLNLNNEVFGFYQGSPQYPFNGSSTIERCRPASASRASEGATEGAE
jgi:hypothetical protein